MAGDGAPPPPPHVDRRSGFCAATGVFHSIRPPIPLPPDSQPLSVAAYALSQLPHPLPSHPAFVDGVTGEAVSYPELVSRIQSLAASLRSTVGISKGHVAFVLASSCLDIPVLYLALLSLGAVVSPANPSSTPDEIARQIHLSNPHFFFATASAASKLPLHATPLLLIDSPQFKSFHADSDQLIAEAEIRQSDPSTILFSSGTTGGVKGVQLTHRNLIAALAAFVQRSKCRRRHAVQLVTPPPFHVFGFLFLIKGVAAAETTVVMTQRFSAEWAADTVRRFRVTHLLLAPPALVALVRVYEDAVDKGRYDKSSLEMVQVGGAPTPLEVIKRFAAMLPNVALSQGYGLTESTSGVFRSSDLEESRRLGSSGRLVSYCEAKIVDPETGAALPPCMRGELWLRGPVIMKGYIGDREATSATLDSQGWLKTGDLCYLDNEGFLFVVDRLKELIKYKGYQVPPAELENLLQKHPDILDAAVIPYPDDEAGQIPMAFVVRRTNSQLNETDVKDFMNSLVAPYKKIRRVCFTNSIPRNPAGKIPRKDLVKHATIELNSKL